ncbi:hypothetical protein ONR57_03420 [Hoyosella sp. YIM 151337]|uniref:hypothetical protein n=1 Tax=Hoyosella sp. YIM 151337 TaxID=2992742 RepID=UPI002236A3CC|nr:hypothetical protein [Hoyosella sp. YIM 151337]MCW4352346.1 hypothetical protein [Hoyosella sp. YIM 151337]
MEPIEINAGEWYLRALRCDERVDDGPALAEHGVADPARYVASASRAWTDESRFSWAVCEPTSGEMLGEVALVPLGEPDERVALTAWHNPGHAQAVETARAAVRRFAEGALGMHVTDTAP